jgi:NDP-sugar pyrophosphorylase family protein
MIAVIVLSGPLEGMHGLDAERSSSLLPLGDRPALQHIVESLVTQGITRIELIVGHGPERVEGLLGTGDRWGCNFRYHLASDPIRPYRSLNVIAGLKENAWVLIHAERYPCVDFPIGAPEKSTLYYGTFSSTEAPQITSTWGGTAVLSPEEDIATLANCTYEELCNHFEHPRTEALVDRVTTDSWIDVSSPTCLLKSQWRLLDKTLRGLLISGAEREPGVWIARNATIHPSVRITAPLYIGTNTRLSKGVKVGPRAVIGPDCIVDSNTVIDEALIFEGSYVGEGLEVHKAIVAHNLLVNVRLDASVDISENFLLGRLDRPRPAGAAGRFLQRTVAVLLLLLFLPVTLVSWIFYALFRKAGFTSMTAVCIPADTSPGSWETFRLPCLGADAWSITRPAGWSAFCRQFLPGLFAVVVGRLTLVGMPPRTAEQIAALDDDWRALYLEGRAGLITEAATAITDPNDAMQVYLADAYYSIQRGFSHNLALIAKYFLRLIVPRSK